MNRGLSLIFVAASLIVLAGCTISGGGSGGGGTGPFPGETADTVSVAPDFDSPAVRQGVTLSAGQSQLYEVDISDSVAQNNDVVYFDAVPLDPGQVDGYLEVTAYSVSGDTATPLYVSTTNQWFGRPSDPGLASLGDSEYRPTNIANDAAVCGGPCVVVPTPSGAGTAYVRVEAIQGTVTYDFYVVATGYFDVGEPNDSFASAETVGASNTIVGTIEIVGDHDWYVPDHDVFRVDFNGDPDLNLRAVVYNESGSFLDTLQPGQFYELPSGFQQLRVEVYSDPSQERAAAAGRAQYTVDFQ